jgi:hypothetical protein
MPERTDIPTFPAAPPSEESSISGVSERRAGGRYPFTASVEVYDLRAKTRVSGRCSDLGPGGCYVDTLSPLGVGTQVRIHMSRADREFEAWAVVAYAHLQLGMGLSFTAIKPEHQAVLRDWIGDLTGERPASLEPAGITAPAPAGSSGDPKIRVVINELISLLVRRKLISEEDGTELLRQMFH